MAIGSMTTNSTVDMIDKTLKTENAPADAAAVGRVILDFTKETPQPIFYSKAEVDNLLEECKEAAKRAALLAANPVGKLWASDDPTSPASIVGGTWEQIKDRFILAAGDTYSAGSTGGEAEHTLTESEMPRHKHETAKGERHDDETGTKFEQYDTYQGESGIVPGYYWTASTLFAGNSQPHNNMPPYVAMYVWKRIA